MHCHKKNYFQGGVSESAKIKVHTIDYSFCSMLQLEDGVQKQGSGYVPFSCQLYLPELCWDPPKGQTTFPFPGFMARCTLLPWSYGLGGTPPSRGLGCSICAPNNIKIFKNLSILKREAEKVLSKCHGFERGLSETPFIIINSIWCMQGVYWITPVKRCLLTDTSSYCSKLLGIMLV